MMFCTQVMTLMKIHVKIKCLFLKAWHMLVFLQRLCYRKCRNKWGLVAIYLNNTWTLSNEESIRALLCYQQREVLYCTYSSDMKVFFGNWRGGEWEKTTPVGGATRPFLADIMNNFTPIHRLSLPPYQHFIIKFKNNYQLHRFTALKSAGECTEKEIWGRGLVLKME